ncbi:hypothetical protein IEQ34_008100 [Dendrobium chrysotoxum]|uniref:RING-type domain-containing protein n=1 Tax=Dendrobium chrysotoxum TaxID=161865 RepID=A0AAV7H7N2_DENCH|nr:hypothetical protein IEQ34_008100 [Dendrobium chrysotoxum]
MNYATATAIIIVVLLVLITITFFCYLVCSHSTAAPPLQPEANTETGLNDTTLESWPTLTYAEAKRQDPRAAAAGSCSLCFVDYNEEEEGKDQPLRLLPDCGHLFHAVCVDPWLRQHGSTCPLCRSSVMNVATQMSLADGIPLPLEIDLA